MRRPQGWLVGLLVLLHGILAWSASPRVGVTADEPIHVVSGLYYWKTNDYRFQPENGNLPQRWVALPWVLAGVRVPATEGAAWERGDIWSLGHRLLVDAGPRRTALLAASRGMNVLLGCALVWVIYAWSATLWGRGGGLVSLLLATFSPNLLAHAGLATSDTAGALGFVAALLAAWRLCHRITPGRIVQTGAAAGLLAVSKFSAVLLVPMLATLVAIRVWRGTPLVLGPTTGRVLRLKRRGAQLVALLGAMSIGAAIAWAIVWTAYGWRFEGGSAGGRWMKEWDTLLMSQPQHIGLPQLGEPPGANTIEVRAGLVQAAVRQARDLRLLPEAWLYGLSFVAYHSHSRLSFFNGEYRTTGWRLYFPSAWGWKSSLPEITFLLLALTLLATRTARRRELYRATPLLVLLAIYGGTSIAGSLNIGLRHWLPILAAAAVLGGGATRWLSKTNRNWRHAIGALALGSHLVTGIAAHPHYLTYFNVLAGPRENHHRLLADSNLDWGQGLPDLAEWLREHRAGRAVFLSYFGSDAPRFHALPDVVRFGDLPFDYQPRALPAQLLPGLYVFGATQFDRVYSTVRGPWTTEREKLYWQLRELIVRNAQRPSGSAFTTAGGRALTQEEIELALRDYDSLTLGRLTTYLNGRAPLAVLSCGMLIFELRPDDPWWTLPNLPGLPTR